MSAATVPSRERFSGCLVGQCLGDALGFPVEGWPPEDCAEYVREELESIRQAERFPTPDVLWAGQYTDDSQLARELMQSYAARGQFDPQDYAHRIAAIFAEERIVGRGMATDAAACRLKKGVHWKEAGEPAPSAGNGTAMRAGPIGLLFGDDPAEMARVAREQGHITHQDGRCAAGSIAVAGAVALAARAGEVRPETWVEELSEWVSAADDSFGREILGLPSLIALPPEEAAPLVARSGNPDFEDGWKWISPYVVPSVIWSLYSFLRTPEDYWATIRTAIEAGGDVDTTAAMAGAVSGAHLGLDGLPRAAAQHVTDHGTWGFGELVDLAHQCHALKTTPRG